MSEKLDIAPEIGALCAKLGLDKTLVQFMTLEPSKVTASVFLTNAEGSKYLNYYGTVALEVRQFAVTT